MSRAWSSIGWIRGMRPRTKFGAGAVFLVTLALVITALVAKPTLQTMLRSGDTIVAEFDKNYHHALYPTETEVKLAGIKVGIVSGIEQTDKGTVRISMKVDDSTLNKLGSKPSARIAPKTVLGGEYAIELKPGGGSGHFDGEVIPTSRTRTPVELDRILGALPKNTRQSLQGMVDNLEGTLSAGGSKALRDLVAHAPATLDPAADVLSALRGTRPGVDLPRLVTNLESTANALHGHSGQLADIVDSLERTTTVLAEESDPLATTVATLPATLRNTRKAMGDLNTTLAQLESTAKSARPAVRELDPLLERLNPVLKQAKPLLRDLVPLLRNARPTVDALVPVAEKGTKVLQDVRGPVLHRINGPVMDMLLSTYRGSGPYKGSGDGMQANHKFYEELAFMITNLDRASKTQDSQGSLLNFEVGAGTRSAQGLPFTPANLLKLANKYAEGHQ